MVSRRDFRIAGFVMGVLGALMLLAGTARAADPVVNPGSSFGASVIGGEIKIGTTMDPIDVGTMSPPPRLKNVTINPDGSFSAAATDFTFPQLVLPVDSPVGTVDIFVQIRAASPVTGTIDPASGEVSLSTSLTIQLTSNHAIVALGNNCYVGTPANPIPFNAIGGASKGVPYDEYAGTTTIVDDTLAIPTASGCPTIVGNNVNAIVNSTMGLPSPSGQNTATLAMRFNPAPHSENWVDPNGPDDIPPTIINDEVVTAGDGLAQRSWLESFAISNDRDQNNDDGDTGGASLNRASNTVRISLLVKHNPGREVTGLKIDDNWDASDDSDVMGITPVTAQQPDIVGGFNYSRVTFEYQAPTAGMGLTCPGFFDSNQGPKLTSRQISVRAVLDNGTESESSVSGIRLTRADCNAKEDGPMLYGWQAQDPAGGVTPGTPVTFTFRTDDTDAFPTARNQAGGYTWRIRNLDTGATGPSHFVCAGSNIDGATRTIEETFSQRGRWVVEAQVHDLNGPFLNDCLLDEFGSNSRPWYWVGAVDVNSPAEISGVQSPGAVLSVPARPAADGSITATVNTNDPFDVANGGRTQAIEWDIDGDDSNGVDGFDLARLGDSQDGLTPGQNQLLIDASEMAPGFHPVRVRVGDNGALGAADDIRRTNVATSQFMVNTPPVAGNLSVSTEQDESVATPLVASDTNADGSHDPLTWSLKTAPAHGFISGEWPNRVYHPAEGFHGSDSFVYEVNDGFGGISSGTVSITVEKAVEPPVEPPVTPDPGPEKQALKATFDEGRVNLNEEAGPSTSGVKVVDSSVPDPPVVFDTKHWNRSTGEILAPPSDLTIPAKTVALSITDPLPLDLQVTIEFSAISNIGGSFDPKTGAMNLDFDARALITVNAPAPLGQVLKCDVTPIPLSLSTSGGDLVDPGQGDRPAATWSPKAFGSDAKGAVTSLWTDLPASTALAEPMAPLASCGDTLDGLIGGKGGFWLGGKVTFDGAPTPDPDPDPGTRIPKGVATFDGKRLFIHLYCPKVFKPKCKTTSVPVTRKVSNKAGKKARKKAKPMAKPVKVKIKSGKWKKVSYLIKPKFRAKVQKMVGKKKRLLVIRDTVKAKKMGKKKMKKGKSRTFFHRHKVRAG